MSSLLVQGHRALQVAAVFVSAGAFLTALGSHRRVLNVLKSERDKLQNLTAASEAISIRLERAQCDLRGAEEESARSRDYSTQIAVELAETQSKMDDIRQLLATLGAELESLEEARVAEERRHLRQLLISCSEVPHDSSK
jgi:septal ring factor EnvC (AmiA/AmiB activator)